jgi:ATP-binding cassette subfamily B protein
MLRSLKPLWPYVRKYRKDYFYGGWSVLLANGIWIVFPKIVGHAIDDLRKGVTHQKLVHYALILVAIAGLKGIFQFLTRWIVIGISREIEFDLRNDLFGHLERLSSAWYQRMRTGDIMARATNDLNAVRMMLGPAIMYPANTVVLAAGAVTLMLMMSPRLTLYAFLPLPLFSLAVQYYGRKIHERFESIQAQFSDISAQAQENFSAARLIRAYGQEEMEIKSFRSANQEYIARSLPLARLMGMLWPTLETLLQLAIVLVFGLGGRYVVQGRMSVGDFVAFLGYMALLMWPVMALGWVINLFQRGTASLGRIYEILQEKPEVADAPPMSPAPGNGLPHEISGEIEFRDLTFSYNGTPVLDGINLKVPAGGSLAVVGPTGSGKTTLVSLIPRIYDAPPGTVLVDGRPVRDFPLAQLRASIGFVPQETFLFGATVRENIALGAEHATAEDVRHAAEVAGIAAEIEALPDQYQTIVGERGITLSGGQKQRTAIARAVLRDPRILILDDALSSVDTHTEDHILSHLREIMRGRTTIFISHRVSTVRNADRIAVLHGGRIVECGTHDELLARDGYYTDLYNKQLLEEELAGETV